MRPFVLARILTVATLIALAGCEPDDITGSGPEAAVKAADFFAVDDVPVPDNEGRTGGTLRTPHYTVAVSRILVTEELDEYSGVRIGDGPIKAAPGHELLFAMLEPDQGIWTDEVGSNDPAAVSGVVVIGKREVKLDTLPDGSYQTVMLSVAKGEPVWLRVTDAGRPHSISLRDGSRGPDVNPGLYDIKSGGTNIVYEKSGSVSSTGGYRRNLEVTVRLYRASTHAWTPAGGWAKDGRRWLYVGGLTASSDGINFDLPKREFAASLTLEYAKTFTLVLPDGKTVKPAKNGRLDTYIGSLSGNHSLLFDVPAGFTSGKLRIAPDGLLVARWRDGNQPAQWTKRLPAQEFPISLK